MTQSIPFKITGMLKYPDGKALLQKMQAGDLLAHEKEPINLYDANAIKILAPCGPNHFQLCGYVPRELAARLKRENIVEVKRGIAFDVATVIIT